VWGGGTCSHNGTEEDKEGDEEGEEEEEEDQLRGWPRAHIMEQRKTKRENNRRRKTN
jgi:hypothetical protein